MTASIAALTGLVAGLIHALSGPDHLAAVAPLAADRRGRSWFIGMEWGFGHSLGLFTLCMLALLFRESIDIDSITLYSEKLVGVLLVAVGLWGFGRTMGKTERSSGWAEYNKETPPGFALGIGAIHGCAGGAHFLAIALALSLPGAFPAFAYVLFFGLGAMLAMTGFTALIGAYARAASTRDGFSFSDRYRWMLRASSFAAISVGLIWLTL